MTWTLGQRAPPASFLVVWNGSRGWYTTGRCCHPTGTLSWSKGQRGASGNSAGGKQMQSPALTGAKKLPEKDVDVLVNKNLTVSQDCAFAAETMASCTLGRGRSRARSRWKELTTLLFPHCWGHTWPCVELCTRKWTYWSESSAGPQRWLKE